MFQPLGVRRGLTLIEAVIVAGIIGLLISMTLPAIQRIRGTVDQLRCRNNLREIGRALTHHVAERRCFPAAVTTWGQPQAFLSWETRILPYLEDGKGLWSRSVAAFAIEPLFWREPHIAIRVTEVEAYLCPSDNERMATFSRNQPPAAYTHYLAVSGAKTGAFSGVMFPNSRTLPADVSDGLSNTIMVGERPASSNGRFGWWYAGIGQLYDGSLDSHMAVRQLNQTFYAPMCPLGPYSFKRGRQDDMCSTFHFWSLHPGGAHFLFADGSVRFLKYSADAILPALATRAGKEPLTIPE